MDVRTTLSVNESFMEMLADCKNRGAKAEMILDNFKLALSGINIPIKDIILLGSVDIRRFIKKLIESSYRDLEVLSYGELTENVPVNILKTI